jgi:hypothetical protein
MADSNDPLAALVEALLAEDGARREVRGALREQARLLRELRALGLPTTIVAHRVAVARGIALPIEERVRLANRLRKRAWRGTRGPTDLPGLDGLTPIAASPSDRALPPQRKEENMGKLIKRTITEEFVEEPDTEAEEQEAEEADEEEQAEVEEDAPPARRRRR